MADENKNCTCGDNCECSNKRRYTTKIRVGDGGIGWLGFWAYIGAAVYFVSQSHSFWEGALGLLKALIWPAFLVYQGLTGSHV